MHTVKVVLDHTFAGEPKHQRIDGRESGERVGDGPDVPRRGSLRRSLMAIVNGIPDPLELLVVVIEVAYTLPERRLQHHRKLVFDLVDDHRHKPAAALYLQDLGRAEFLL